jgi:hypothetical protein
MKNIFCILLLITSCSIKGNKQIKVNLIGTTVDTFDERMVIPFEPDSLNSGSNVAHYLIKKFNKEYEGLKDKDIVGVKLIDSKLVKNFGVAQVYNIRFSDNLPEVFTKSNYLIVNKDKKLATLFLLDTLSFIKTSVNDNTILLGGVQKTKSKGFFLIYDYSEKMAFKEILNSLDYCENGIPVFNNSTDCICYMPFMLSFKNIDINNDGILDVNFSGKVASYCKGLETGYGRIDRKPISVNKINFSFILKSKNNNHFKCEFISKDSVCALIK